MGGGGEACLHSACKGQILFFFYLTGGKVMGGEAASQATII